MLNKNTVVTNEQLGLIYPVDSLDGVYYLCAEKPLSVGDVIHYQHENVSSVLKVNQIGEFWPTKQEEIFQKLYEKRIWGEALEGSATILSLKPVKFLSLSLKENDVEFDDKKHYSLENGNSKTIVEVDGRLNKNQVVLVEGEVYKVNSVDNKTRNVILDSMSAINSKGLYSSKLFSKDFNLDSWGKSVLQRIGFAEEDLGKTFISDSWELHKSIIPVINSALAHK